MTGLFAISFLTLSRVFYQTRGMQIGMGLVAGSLRLVNPFGGCFICSALAIMAEGVLFELIWHRLSLDLKEVTKLVPMISLGITSSYVLYVGGYIITQILTPVVSSAGFYVENLVVFVPQILASGLLAALFGGIAVPAMLSIHALDLTIKERLYYPATLGISFLCWCVVILYSVSVIYG